jgi:hypothetical protein
MNRRNEKEKKLIFLIFSILNQSIKQRYLNKVLKLFAFFTLFFLIYLFFLILFYFEYRLTKIKRKEEKKLLDFFLQIDNIWLTIK